MQILPISTNQNNYNNSFKASKLKVNQMSKIIADTRITDELADMLIASTTTMLAIAGIKINLDSINFEKDEVIMTNDIQEPTIKMQSLPPQVPVIDKATPEEFAKVGVIVTKVDENDGLYTIKTFSLTGSDKKISKERKEFIEKHFAQIKEIEGNAHFRKFGLKDLCNLEKIGGNVNFSRSDIETLGRLKEVGGHVFISGDSKVKSLCNLQKVGRSLTIGSENVETLGNLQEVGGSLEIDSTNIETLGNLQKVGGSLIFIGLDLKSFGNLNYVSGDIEFFRTRIAKLGNLQKLGCYMCCYSSPQVKDLLIKNGAILVGKDSIGGEIYRF